MAEIRDRQVLAHVHIMKTGGQTICDILRQSFPGDHCDIHGHFAMAADLRVARQFYSRLSSISGHGVHPNSDLKEVCRSIRYFTFVRDPVRRCVSHYQFDRRKNAGGGDFESWLKRHANYQTRFLTKDQDGPHLRKATADRAIRVLEQHIEFVGLQERFDESLVLLRRWSGEAALDICCRARNIAQDNRIKNQLLSNPSIVAMIQRHHQEDEQVYRHVRDVIYPRQLQRWGELLEEEVTQLKAARPPWSKRLAQRLLASAKRNLLYKPVARNWRRAA